MIDPQKSKEIEKIVLVTGPSGAGRSTAIHAFEDLGFEAIDNMPLSLLPKLLSGPPLGVSIALGIDVRTRDFGVEAVLQTIDHIEKQGIYNCSLLYIDCDTSTLVRRYSETRRRHPLAENDSPLKAIENEKLLLVRLRNQAEVLIDSTTLTAQQLGVEIDQHFGGETSNRLSVSVQSFSYKRGTPRGIDMVLDCRFLRNPYWDINLRDRNGLDKSVKSYIAQDKRYTEFVEKSVAFLEFLLPAYREEGKSHFNLGLGCTGGQHRSVCLAEEIAKHLAQTGWHMSLRHRELERQVQA